MNKNLRSLLAATCVVFAVQAQTTTNFSYTGVVQYFTVPPCVYNIDVVLNGAKGGDKDTAYGGKGGKVTCTVPVTPGEILQIFVGGAGVNGDNVSGLIAGGFNGGGHGWDDADNWGGAGGGGASDIRRAPYSLNDRLVVAGGGGAGGIDGCSSINLLKGGMGGGLVGANGMPSPSSCVGSGQGGTQTAGGLKGQYTSCTNSSFDGSFGFGGDGYGNCSNSDDGGSGGGGGWYGGGAGNFGAGGGGSSYTAVTCTNVVHTQGVQSGDGSVSFTYTPGVTVTYNQATTNMCTNWGVQNLTPGTPSGGTYSGTAVIGNTFNPTVSGAGSFSIIYTYYDSVSGCTNSDTSVIVVSTCAATGHDRTLFTINVYPNPFGQSLTVSLGEMKAAEIFIYNIVGETIGVWKTESGSEKLDINTSKFPSGIYFVKVRTEDGTLTRKVIKE